MTTKDVNVTDTKAGIIGDNATAEGGIHNGDCYDIETEGDAAVVKGNGTAVIVKMPEKIDNSVPREDTGWIITLWRHLNKRKVRYRQSLEDINRITYGDPLEIAKYYVEPNCQDINPADHHTEHAFVSQELLMKKINEFFQAPSFSRGDNQMFILSDAGMGKTALVIMLKLMDITMFWLWPRRKACVFKKLGKETLYEVEKIKHKSDTILLLDSLDEDPAAYGRVRERLLDILRETKNFYKVIITCRTQFIPRVEEDPFKRPGFFKMDEFTCHAKYISFFSDKKVEQYLEKRFPKKFFFWRDNKKIQKAQDVINKMGLLRCRPMLLSYIENLMYSSVIKHKSSEYHVYDALVQSWLIREKEKIKEVISEEKLLKACIILATIMQIRGKRSVSEKDLDKLIDQIDAVLPVKKIDIKGRSLINRNSEGDYRFSHYSIQEFCVAKLLLEKPVFKKLKGKILVTDFIFRQIAKSGKTPNFNEHLDFKGLNFNTPELKNLRGLSLHGVDLSGKDLTDVDLSNAKLNDCKLTGTIFKNANLKDVNFEGSDYWNAKFEGAEFKSLPSIKNELGMKFVFVPSGTFMMGSPEDEPGRNDENDEMLHEVNLTKGYFMQTTHITVGIWRLFAATGYKTEAEKGDGAYGRTGSEWKKDKKYYWDNPGFNQADTHPVTCISWNDVLAFVEWLKQKDGKTYRLPTEAEWEYACRAGTKTRYNTGDGEDDLNRSGWYRGNSNNKTHPVGEKESNKWGLYDMHGNVLEWSQDIYGYYPSDFATDPDGKKNGSKRVIRGGSWSRTAKYCRSAYRLSGRPENRVNDLGFRLVFFPTSF